MKHKVLFVDDEENILSSFKRNFGSIFDVETALDLEEAMEKVQFGGPYSVVVSDYRMPGGNGLQFISFVKTNSSDTVCIMLTGHADKELAIEALNEGNIFRFLTKPCESLALEKAIKAAIRQYSLIMAERELYELKGLLAMCSHCKKIRDEHGQWLVLEDYIESHSTATVSHTFCPVCMKELYPTAYKTLETEGLA